MAYQQRGETIITSGGDALRTFLDDPYRELMLELIREEMVEKGVPPGRAVQILLRLLYNRDAKLGKLGRRTVWGELMLFISKYAGMMATEPEPVADVLGAHFHDFLIMFLETRLRGVDGFTADKLTSATRVFEQRMVTPGTGGGFLERIKALLGGGGGWER